MTTAPIPTQQQRASAALAPFEPTNIEEAMRLAATLAKSSLVPRALQNNPSDVLIVLMKGRELGLPPMASLANLHVIDGKACCSSDMLQGIVYASGKCEFFRLVESDGFHAVYEGKRKDSPNVVKIEWTMDDAKAANLLGKANWKSYPKAMLRARAASDLARECWPDVASGLYDLDEADDLRGEPVPTQVIDDGQPKRPRTIDALKATLTNKPTGAASNSAPSPAEPVMANTEPAAPASPSAQDDAPWSNDSEGSSDASVQPAQPQAAQEPEDTTLDPAQPMKRGAAFGERMRFPVLPEPWERWCDTKPWGKSIIGEYTPRQVIDGSLKGKRHKGLDAIVSWAEEQVRQGKYKPIDVPAPAVYADYCLAFLEAKHGVERAQS